MHTLCSIRQGCLNQVLCLSKARWTQSRSYQRYFHSTSLSYKANPLNIQKDQAGRPFKDEDCMLINQLLYLSCLGKYCLFVNKRFTLNFLQTKEHKAGLDCIQRGRKLPAVKATEISMSTVINTPSCVLKHKTGSELISKQLSFHQDEAE